MDKVMDKICEMFHEVLYDMAEKGHFGTANDVETTKAAVSGIVKIKTLEAMEHFDGGGSSFRGRSYEDGGSYRRGRGMDGRFVSRDGYSRDGGSMREKLQRLMDEAGNERERNMLHEMIQKLEH